MSAQASKLNVEDLILRIREEVKQELAKDPQNRRFVPPLSAKRLINSSKPLISSEELRYLNLHWHDWNAPAELSSHRKVLGPVIVLVKKFIAKIIWHSFLKGYIERERQFQMQLVRFLNQTAGYIDERNRVQLVEIAEKIDSDVRASNQRSDLLYNELLAAIHQLRSDLEKR